MKLYIANATRQIQDFVYRLPEQISPFRQTIPVGTQVRIARDDLTIAEIDYIVKQHARYGLVRADEVDRTKPFIGMCYAIDKPVQSTRLLSAMEHNMDVLTLRGQENRKMAAIVANESLDRQANAERIANLEEMELTIVEEGKGPTTGPKVNEGILVSRNAEASTGKRGRVRSGRGKKGNDRK